MPQPDRAPAVRRLRVADGVHQGFNHFFKAAEHPEGMDLLGHETGLQDGGTSS
jgi:hypothetical protein